MTVSNVAGKVGLTVLVTPLPTPRKKGEKTIGTSKKGDSKVKKEFRIPIITAKEMDSRINKAVATLKYGVKALKPDNAKALKKELTESIIAELKEKHDAEITKLKETHKKEVDALLVGKLRAKFSCVSIKPDENGEAVKLFAVYGTDDKDNEENNQFSEATPSGEHEMYISNPSARGFFSVDESYYLDFTKAPKVKTESQPIKPTKPNNG